MGNHEYCTDCGASDFHFGRPCNPERLAKETARKKEIEDRTVRLNEAAARVCKELVGLGYPAKIGEYGHVVIEKWNLTDTRFA